MLCFALLLIKLECASLCFSGLWEYMESAFDMKENLTWLNDSMEEGTFVGTRLLQLNKLLSIGYRLTSTRNRSRRLETDLHYIGGGDRLPLKDACLTPSLCQTLIQLTSTWSLDSINNIISKLTIQQAVEVFVHQSMIYHVFQGLLLVHLESCSGSYDGS